MQRAARSDPSTRAKTALAQDDNVIFYRLTVNDCSSLKLSADSAGRTTSLLPVNAAPRCTGTAAAQCANGSTFAAAQQAANQRARCCATARQNGRALAFALFRAGQGRSLYTALLAVDGDGSQPDFESGTAGLNRPRGFASTTVPRASAPDGMTVVPSTSMGGATVALNDCPGLLIFEPTASPRRTVNIVPAGTTTA